jgi:hypothetical protein
MSHESRRVPGYSSKPWYSALAAHTRNVLLFLVVANVALGAAYAVKDERDRHEPTPFFTAFRERHGPSWVSLLYPGWDERTIVQFYREWQQMAYGYDPFSQFVVRPMQGAHINVSEHGFRLNGRRAPWPPDDAAFNIFVFGGSTTFGLVPDTDTIPAAMETYLTDRSCGTPARVYNFGQPAYYSMQERALFEHLLLKGAVPNLAVFIDGLNDSIFVDLRPRYTAELTQMMDQVTAQREPRNWTSGMRELVDAVPMSRLARWVRARLDRSWRDGDRALHAGPSAELPVETRLDQWITNKRFAEATGQQLGVRTLFVWQPVATYNYDVRYHAFGDLFVEWKRRRLGDQASEPLYVLLNERRHEASVQRNFLWLADMQLTRQENLYVDSLHYTQAFSRDIAVAIVDDLGRRGWLPCVPQAAG